MKDLEVFSTSLGRELLEYAFESEIILVLVGVTDPNLSEKCDELLLACNIFLIYQKIAFDSSILGVSSFQNCVILPFPLSTYNHQDHVLRHF